MDFHVATVDRLLANIDALLYNIDTLLYNMDRWLPGRFFVFFNERWMNIFFAMY